MDFNPRTGQRNIENITLATKSQNDLSSFRSADQLDRILCGHALGWSPVNADDHVFGLNSSTGCRRPLDRGHNDQLLGVLIQTQLDADPHQLS